MRLLYFVIIILVLFSYSVSGCEKDLGDRYLKVERSFTTRIATYDITFGPEVNRTYRGFKFTIYTYNYTDDLEYRYLNLTAVILLNESLPVLDSPDDYMADGVIKVRYEDYWIVGKRVNFPFVSDTGKYYEWNETVFFNGTMEEKTQNWNVDNPYKVKLVLYYEGDFPSRTYGFEMRVFLAKLVCLGEPSFVSSQNSSVQVIVIPVVLAITFLSKRRIKKQP